MTGTIFSMPKPEPDPHPATSTLVDTLDGTSADRESSHAPRTPLRASLLERGGAEMRRAERYDRPLSLIVLRAEPKDEDHGIMREVLDGATRIGADIVVELGPCHFACLLPETNLSGAMHLAARMQKRIAAVSWPDGRPRLIPVRAGFSALSSDDATFADVLGRAEAMLRPRRMH